MNDDRLADLIELLVARLTGIENQLATLADYYAQAHHNSVGTPEHRLRAQLVREHYDLLGDVE